MRKETSIDEILIYEDKSIRYRTRLTAFDDDETAIGVRYKYVDLKQGDDVSTEPPVIRKIATAVWA